MPRGNTTSKLSDEELIMQDTPEMRTAAIRESTSRLRQMNDRGITAGLKDDEKKRDAKIIQLCKKKSLETGSPASSFANGQELYVNSLIEFAGMSPVQRYQWGKAQAFPSVATAAEALSALT